MEQKLYDAASKLPETGLAFDEIQAPAKSTARPWRKVAVLAACLALVIGVGFGTYAYAEEVKEYNEAVQFFADNGLSTEGLTRKEIKAVYRDITTKSFTYFKTAEVIESSITAEQVAGYEILQDGFTPEEMINLWNYMNSAAGGNTVTDLTKEEYQYRLKWDYYEDKNGKLGEFEKSRIEKYDGDTLLWSASLAEFWIDGYSVLSDGVMAYGYSGRNPVNSWIAKVSESGEVLWKSMLDNGLVSEYIRAVVENGDGSYAVFSMGETEYVCLNQITADGKQILFKKTAVEEHNICGAARQGDGYLVQLNYPEGTRIVRVDHEGNLKDAFSYTDEDTGYYIQDTVVLNGKVYVSAYISPKLAERESGNFTSQELLDIFALCDDLRNKKSEELEKEDTTPGVDITDRIKNHFSAILMVCDASTGTPQEFYTVQGAFGGTLTASDDGMLLWEVQSIVKGRLQTWSNGMPWYADCQVYCYTFDNEGKIVSQEKTDKIVRHY